MKKNWQMGHWEKGHYISKGKRGYWSKYGGGRQIEDTTNDNWSCQSCSEDQFNVLPSYKILFDQMTKETVRVCALCKHVSLVQNLNLFDDLIDVVRVSDYMRSFKWMVSLANLMTLPLP